jgi:hypothetical protein
MLQRRGGRRKYAAEWSLVFIPVGEFERIARFSSGIDMYNLALTAKHPFFSEYFVDRGQEPPQQRGSALATRLLRIAIEATMTRLICGVGGTSWTHANENRVRLHDEPGRWVSARLDMHKLHTIMAAADEIAPNQVIISGSLVVQAVLGAGWAGSDIDIFCTSQVAPYVRAALVNVAGFGFTGFKEGRYEVLEAARRHEGQIEHVESWVVMPDEGSEFWGEDTPEARAAQEEDNEPALLPPCRELCVDYGRRARMRSGSYILFNAEIGHDMTTVPEDNPLPYNRDFWTWPGFCEVADLIVGNAKSVDPREILDSFDINICKAYYNGSTFHIEDPHLSFNMRSRINHPRAALITHYLDWAASENFTGGPKGSGGISYADGNHGAGSHYEGRNMGGFVPPVQMMVDAGVSETYFDRNREREGTGSQHQYYHTFIKRMVDRIQKYAGRGIKYENAPPRALVPAVLEDMVYT